MAESPVSDRHWHWEFLAFDAAEEKPLEIRYGVTVEVIGYLCEADARIAAQDVITRQHFHLRRVWECQACGYQGSMVQAVNDLVKAST